MRVMKVFCPECGSAANIRKTNRKDVHLSDLYCQCSDVECSHSFVLNVTFSHTISPSAKTGNGLVRSLLNLIQPKDRQMALELLQGRA